MSSKSRSGKRNLLSRVFSNLRGASRSQVKTPGSTQTPSPALREPGRAANELSSPTEGGHGADHHSHSPSSSQAPATPVEDHSSHHHGDRYELTQHVHGTANFVRSVSNATFGPNSVTTIERATFFSAGNVSSEAALLWDTLPKQRDIGGPENEYLDGSREDVVQDVQGWFEDPTSEVGFLIQGAAGLGKSTFARHLTHQLHGVGRLAASVSLSALPSDSRSPSSVVKMAARELGRIHPKTIPAILEAIRSCEAAPLVNQLEMFLIAPVRSLGLPHPLAVIFDAVDEYESHSALINALSSLPPTASLSIKFILLGRSNPRGRKDGLIRLYPLQPVSTATMERFLGKQLEGVPWEHGKRYAEVRIIRLAELANGVFIWARVVCSLLQRRLSRFSPDNILDSILDSRRTLGDSEQIAMLYHQAIMLLFPDSEGQQLFREYLTATLALQESLPIDEFSAFTNLPTRVIEGIQAELKALQIRKPRGAKDEGAQVHPAGSLFHLSFLEYLKCTSTPAHIAFHVSLFASHSQLAEFCLAELPRFLPSPRPLSHLDLYPRRRYAVTHLMVHIHHGSPSVQPGSAEEWEHSTLCATLRRCSFELLQRWADLVVDLVGGAPVIEEYTGGARDMSEEIGEVDAVDGSDNHEDRDEKRSESGSGDTELGENNEFMARNVDHGATDGGEAPKDAANYDTWVAQLLHGVATTFGEEYTSRSSLRTSCLEVAVRFRPHDAGYWHELGWAYHFVAQWSGSVKAHDWAVIAHQNALRGVGEPAQHDPGRFPYGLATALHKRFWAFGRPEDLDQSIALHRDALARRPPGHPQRGLSLNNLARSIGTYVMERGSRKGEIDEMISLQREALDFLPQGHEDTSMYLYNLAAKLRCRYEMKASIVDLEEAIRLGREAVALCPSGHPARASALNELAWDLTIKYKAQDDSGSLEEAIRISRESLSLCPIGNPERPNVLDTLATALHFVQGHLGEALQLSRESLSLIPLNHSYRWEVMSIVASIHLSHYERSGSAEDLEEATSVCEQALSLCPPNHIRRPRLLALQAKLAEATSSASSFKS